jgi:hypothetical protein
MNDPEYTLARDPARDEPHCSCGALTGSPTRRCRKCRARSRWNHRRTNARGPSAGTKSRGR